MMIAWEDDGNRGGSVRGDDDGGVGVGGGYKT